ncbi:hypothetical protein [Bacteroides sp.]|uniref:hypothetical protein n=1 Tax=Bacteroides sp. TaxID=29523 RepID=UPI0025B84BAC|nr:hypothetical protein [Bacteroides sp.]
MAKFKIWMVALTLIMGVSFTSCVESDPTVTNPAIGQVESILPLVIKTPDGTKFTAANSLGDMNYTYNDFMYFIYSFNSDEQDVTSKNITATISSIVKLNSGYAMSSSDKGESNETATIVQIGDNPTNSAYYHFSYYDEYHVVVPIYYLAEKEITKHSFTLYYDESEFEAASGMLKLYLRHRSEEEKSTLMVSYPLYYNVFDVRSALMAFQSETGSLPAKITIYANETSKSNSDKLEDKKEELTAYTVEYPYKD